MNQNGASGAVLTRFPCTNPVSTPDQVSGAGFRSKTLQRRRCAKALLRWCNTTQIPQKQAELARFTRINAAAQVNHSSFTSRLQAYDLRRAGRLIDSVFSVQT